MSRARQSGAWRRQSIVAGFAGALAALAAMACSRPMTSPGAAANVTAGPDRVERGEYSAVSGRRAYRLFVPASVKPPATMLVLLHGCLQDAADIAAGSRMDDVAASEGFVVLYPEQSVTANPRKCWNWFESAHQSRDAGEPAIIAGMIDEVAKLQGIDARRVHLAGISAGAAMAGLVAAAYPERTASVSLLAGVAWKAATNVGRALVVMKNGAGDAVPVAAEVIAAMGQHARDVPTLVLHGGKDVVLDVRNGEEAAAQAVRVHDALRTRTGRPALRGVGAAARTENGYVVNERSWLDERGNARVTYVRVEGLGHAWSAGAKAGTFTDSAGPDGSRMIARFIAQHALPPR